MEKEIRELIDDAKPVDEGLTNKVYFKEDKVIKVYSRYPATSIYASVLRLLKGDICYLDRQTRIENEVEMKEKVRKTGLNAKEVISTGKEAIVFEKVEGESGYEYLNSSKSEEAEKLGRKLRKFMEKLHENDSALIDARISNFLVDEETIYSIDHEYSSTESTKMFAFLDKATLTATARQTENYESFVEGLRPGIIVRLSSLGLSLLHATVLEHDMKRVMNIFRS